MKNPPLQRNIVYCHHNCAYNDKIRSRFFIHPFKKLKNQLFITVTININIKSDMSQNSEKIIDVANMLISYANNTIYIIIDDMNEEPWFNAKDCATFLDYIDQKNTIKQHVSQQNRAPLKSLVSEYKILYKNAQGHSIYINERGFYQLLMHSKKPNAKEV